MIKKTFLALGDSYTIGESVPAQMRWPVQLAEMLRAEGFGVEEPHIIATSGWTSRELMEGIAASKLAPEYDLVSLLIGVNNQYRGGPLETYREEFEKLLQQAIALAGKNSANVFVLSIPDWGVTPIARQDQRSPAEIREEVTAFNRVNRVISQQYGVWYVDVFPISLRGLDDPAWTAADGLHPSGQQYRQWAQAALPIARNILR